jgi:hypothetical protein
LIGIVEIAGRVTNFDDANQYLTREYRAGWNMQS